MSKLRWLLVIVFLIGTVAAGFGIDVRATYGARVTADEPQYLLTAISLAEDRSLDISDEIEGLRYLPFHEIRIDRQTDPLPDGSEVSPHDPGLPALLALPMDLGGWRAAKWTLSLMNGVLAALILWISVRRLGARVEGAVLVSGLLAASAPFAVYGNQVYPEIVAALCVASCVGFLLGPLKAGGIAGTAASLVALPWLSVKYIPVAATLGVLLVVALWRSERRRELLWTVASLAAAGVVFVLTHLDWYGGLTPYATGDHFVDSGEFSVVGTNVNLLGRARRLVGLLIDDKFGLVVWQPLYLLVVPAVAAFAVSKTPDKTVLLAPAAVGWLNATFVALTMQGWWWPGRQVVVILPCLAICLCAWVSTRRRMLTAVVLGAVGCVTYAWLVIEGLQGRLTWVVDFFTTRNFIYRGLASITPDYLDVHVSTWLLQGIWIVLFITLAWWAMTTAREGEGSAPSP